MNAQAFSFQLAFEDAAGNRDTLELGFDPNATDGIDASFGETNLLGTAPNSGLDVRVSDEWEKRMNQGLASGTFHTKKQILEKTNCSAGIANDYLMSLTLDIRTDFWPVTVSWDSAFFSGYFNDTSGLCYGLALLTDGPYNGIQGFVDGYSNLPLVSMQSSTNYSFSTNVSPSTAFPQHSYMDAAGDSVPVFWFFFNELTFYQVGIEDEMTAGPKVEIFPNPSHGQNALKIDANGHEITDLKCFDLQGKEMPTHFRSGQIDISMFPAGMYCLKGVLDDHLLFREAFVVQRH